MRKIELTQGKYAIVDDEDYHYLIRFTWTYSNTEQQYEAPNESCTVQVGRKAIQMHNMILPARKGHYLRHKNGSNLDNRKSNLEEISLNHRRHLGLKKQMGASKYRGVQRSSKNSWRVVIGKDKVRYFIGNFKLHEEKKAAIAYNKKARELYGENAYQNEV